MRKNKLDIERRDYEVFNSGKITTFMEHDFSSYFWLVSRIDSCNVRSDWPRWVTCSSIYEWVGVRLSPHIAGNTNPFYGTTYQVGLSKTGCTDVGKSYATRSPQLALAAICCGFGNHNWLLSHKFRTVYLWLEPIRNSIFVWLWEAIWSPLIDIWSILILNSLLFIYSQKVLLTPSF